MAATTILLLLFILCYMTLGATLNSILGILTLNLKLGTYKQYKM